jgi:hypothetical protein
MNSELPQDVLVLLIGLSIVTGLFSLSLVRTFRLLRANNRMEDEIEKMEKQSVLQQLEVTSVHHDAMSWRAKTQRQFDALRSELSHRLHQVDQGGANALKEMDAVHQQTLAVALAKISELEAALAAQPKLAAAALPPPFTAALPKASLPPLPAMDTLRIQSLESELAATKAEIAIARQQNSALQRALLLARRRAPVPAMRKSTPRGAVRSA